MTHPGYGPPNRARNDGRMIVLDLAPELRYCPRADRVDDTPVEMVEEAVRAARWPGQVLPQVRVLGVRAHPVVQFTGAGTRLQEGHGPELVVETLDLWEALGTVGGDSPLSPLSIVGFVSTTRRWQSAVESARAVAGLGAGMVVRPRQPTALQLMDADVTGVWVAGRGHAASPVELWVQGRVGPVQTSTRSPAHRRMEEGLFAHALSCGALLRA